MRATPPCERMSAGTRSSAITATAPASSAMRACSASTTSMITPPLSISARPVLTRSVPISSIAKSLLRRARAIGFAEAPQEVAQLPTLLLVEAIEKEPLDARDVCLGSGAQLREPAFGKEGVLDSRVLFTGRTIDIAHALESLQQPGDPGRREHHLLREINPPHPAIGCAREPEQHLVIVDRQAVLGLELPRQLAYHRRVRAQEERERLGVDAGSRRLGAHLGSLTPQVCLRNPSVGGG